MSYSKVSEPDLTEQSPGDFCSCGAELFSHLLEHLLTAAVGDTCFVPRKRGVKYPFTFLDSWLRRQIVPDEPY